MTGRAVVREGSCPSVQKRRADVRESKYPGGQVSGIPRRDVRRGFIFMSLMFSWYSGERLDRLHV